MVDFIRKHNAAYLSQKADSDIVNGLTASCSAPAA